jgi:hypothetical protein
VSENGDASAPAPVVDRDLHPYSIQAFLNAIHLDDLSANRRGDSLRIRTDKSVSVYRCVRFARNTRHSEKVPSGIVLMD